MIKEHDIVVLTEDVPEEGLTAGDVGTVVHIHNNGEGYEVEFNEPYLTRMEEQFVVKMLTQHFSLARHIIPSLSIVVRLQELVSYAVSK